MKDRAVSEVLGYILVLSVVVATITVIYAAGMPAIRTQQDIAVFRSMENTFYVLQNVERLVAYNVTPEKAVSIRAEGGSIVVVPDWGTMYIATSPPQRLMAYPYGAILYIGGNSRGLILDNGVVLEANGGKIVPLPANLKIYRGIQLIYPRIFRVGNNVYISLINVKGNLSFSGQKMIILKNINSTIINKSVNQLKIRVEITGASKFGWNNKQATELWLNSLKYALKNGTIKKWKKAEWVILSKGGKELNVTIAIYNITVSG